MKLLNVSLFVLGMFCVQFTILGQIEPLENEEDEDLIFEYHSPKDTTNSRQDESHSIDPLSQRQEDAKGEKERLTKKIAMIDSLKKITKAYPVIGPEKDTLFHIYSKIGASSPAERAKSISEKIYKLYKDDFLVIDSIKAVKDDQGFDLVHESTIIMSISVNDALWEGMTMEQMSEVRLLTIKNSIIDAKDSYGFLKVIMRIALVVAVLLLSWLVLWLLKKAHERFAEKITHSKSKWLKSFKYKDYTLLSADQKLKLVLWVVRFVKWVLYAILIYFALPIIFSIFPFSRNWANILVGLLWSPFKGAMIAIWEYLPSLFSIIVIYVIMKYVIRFVRYIFLEIKADKLKLSGFHPDWAMPTYAIVRFLLYAFMFVLIFPYLPGSDSGIFKGVSVFIGVLFSLGSSTAVANMVAGLVITYMRPFKIGDRIKIGEVVGNVTEKTMLVTRVRTIKNEEITIPNSSVLSGNTTNYTAMADSEGLIIHSTVTIGYDVPWDEVHKALLMAADRTELILKSPEPYVYQTSLDDFYVAYQINAYINEANKQALIYSSLHRNILDCFNEMGIEILSPHYRAARDGNQSTVPKSYLPKDYKKPGFDVNTTSEEQSD